MLFVPETVPFRLTRDIVDGFGISGCEGTFIRACTFALTVFREEEDTISTFLDVLKHDPLYNWYVFSIANLILKDYLSIEKMDCSTRNARRDGESVWKAP